MSKSKLDIFLDLSKLIAMVIGGCWVAFQYFEHDAQIKQLDNKRAVLDTILGNQEIVKNKQELKLAQQEDSIKSIELKYMNSLKDSELKALELQNLNNDIQYKYREIETKLGIKSVEVETQLNEIKLKSNLNEKYETKFHVEIEKKGQVFNDSLVYIIKPKLEIINNSINDMEISAVVFEIFYNNLSYRHLEDGVVSLIMLDNPPNIFFEQNSRVALAIKNLSIPTSKWEKIGYDSNIISDPDYFLRLDDNSIIKEYLTNNIFTFNGLGTGLYKPDERMNISPIYYVKLNRAQVVCISVNVLFNKGISGRRFYTDSFIQVLEDVN
ncbi:hypothetical protein [Winogradskyella sp. 3972H.M.0a.05]|uniref:hypothetical protein n=1 Tax=Winogradskyella sp. 3972H.M.0a.05 TaxID=2950277 RepID=UPI00339743D9